MEFISNTITLYCYIYVIQFTDIHIFHEVLFIMRLDFNYISLLILKITYFNLITLSVVYRVTSFNSS